MDKDLCLELARYRLDKARDCIKSAQLNLENGLYTDSANRSYYAIFHSIRAVMALDGEDRKKHSGVMAYFQERYVKSGIFEREYSKIIQRAFEIRQESDYEDFYIIIKEDVVSQIEDAKCFYEKVNEYINTRAE